MENKTNLKSPKNNEYNNLTEIREKGLITTDSIENKLQVELIANRNFIQFLSTENSSKEENIDIFILYKNLVIFAYDKAEKYLLFNYSNDLEEESFQVKFYPEAKDKSNKII
jgi:hypothetical protein